MKLVIADDHAPIRLALRVLLECDLDAQVVGETGDGDETVEMVERLRPQLVLMDVNMPGTDGVAATRSIRSAYPSVRVVALTASQDAASVARMIAAGADSYLVKTAATDELRESLRTILQGQVVLAPEVLPLVVSDLARRLRSEQERADALAELDRTKREFVALVADQLTTPLTAISGYVKTLLSGWDRVDEDLKTEFLERIDQQGERLGRRLRQILTVAQLQTGQGDSSGPPFALDAVVREVLPQVEGGDGERISVVESTEGQVAGDRRALASVVVALVENALVHTGGAVRVAVRRNGRDVLFEVDDDGPGVDPAVLDASLDDLFSPGDASDTRERGGLGLSLYIARRVVEGAGGRLFMQSGPDRGTVVQVCLPAVD